MLYNLKSLRQAKNPNPSDPTQPSKEQWWRYEIQYQTSNENNLIGWRKGSKEEVLEEVEKIVIMINSRTSGKTSTAIRLAHTTPRNISIDKPIGSGLKWFNRRKA